MVDHDLFDPLRNVAHFFQPRAFWNGLGRRCGAEPLRRGLVAWTMAGRILIAGAPGVMPDTR
jgi:hypothetical protein